MGLKSMQEIMESVQENRERLDRIVFIKGGWITINVKYEYDIELKRIKDEAILLSWILHLMEKNWMDIDVLEEFIKKVMDYKGWRKYGL